MIQSSDPTKLPVARVTPDLGLCNPPLIEVQLRDTGRVFKTVVAQSYYDLAEYIQNVAENVVQRFPWQASIEKVLTEELQKMVEWEVKVSIGEGQVRNMLRDRIIKLVRQEIEIWRKFNPEAKL